MITKIELVRVGPNSIMEPNIGVCGCYEFNGKNLDALFFLGENNMVTDEIIRKIVNEELKNLYLTLSRISGGDYSRDELTVMLHSHVHYGISSATVKI